MPKLRSIHVKSLLALSLMLATSLAYSASFDCRKAQSSREKAVCSNAQLSKLDEVLSASYKKAIQISDARPVLVHSQREWLRLAEFCHDVSCLLDSYRNRIELLDSVAPPTAYTAQWTGLYHRYVQGQKSQSRPATLALIGLTENRVLIEGRALWYGRVDTDVRHGEIDEVGVALNQQLFFGDKDEGCNGRLKLSDQSLEVVEESFCGGLNVTFTGQYQREK